MIELVKPITVEEFDLKQNERYRESANSLIQKINHSLRQGILRGNCWVECKPVMDIVNRYFKLAGWGKVTQQKIECNNNCTFTVERKDKE